MVDDSPCYDALNFEGLERRANYRVISYREDVLQAFGKRDAAAIIWGIISRWQDYKRDEVLKEIERRKKANLPLLTELEVENALFVYMSYNDFVRESGGALGYNTVIRAIDYLLSISAIIQRKNSDPRYPDYEYSINKEQMRILLQALPIHPAFSPKIPKKKDHSTQMGTPIEENASTQMGTELYPNGYTYSTQMGTGSTQMGSEVYPFGGTSQYPTVSPQYLSTERTQESLANDASAHSRPPASLDWNVSPLAAETSSSAYSQPTPDSPYDYVNTAEQGDDHAHIPTFATCLPVAEPVLQGAVARHHHGATGRVDTSPPVGENGSHSHLSTVDEDVDNSPTIQRMPAIRVEKGRTDDISRAAQRTGVPGAGLPGRPASGPEALAKGESHATGDCAGVLPALCSAGPCAGESGGQASTRTGIDTLSSGASASATARGGQHADAPVAASRPPGVVSPHATPETPPSRGRKPPEMPLAAIQLLDAWDREFGLSGRPQWVVKAAIDIVTRLKGDIEDVKRVVERMRSLAKYRDKVLNLEQVANEWGLLTQKPAARATPKGGDEPDYLNQDGTTDYLKYIAYKARHPDPIAVAGQAAWGAS